MKYIEAKIFTNSRGVEEVTAELLKMGIEGATVEDPDEIKNIMDKKEGYEWHILHAVAQFTDGNPFAGGTGFAYFDDNEEGRAALQQLKLKMMMLKSKEMEGLFGWDVKLGRLYVEDNIVDDEDWVDK